MDVNEHIEISPIQLYSFFRIWNHSLLKKQPEEEPSNWGWILIDNIYQPLWMTQREASVECRELIKCVCKKGCNSGRCRCSKAGLPCTELCQCGGGCE